MRLSPSQIVNKLIEGEEDFDVRDFAQPIWPSGSDITPEVAMTANRFYHRTQKYARSDEPLQARRNGRTRVWKRRPGYFEIPVKYGLKQCFYITPENAAEWSALPPE